MAVVAHVVEKSSNPECQMSDIIDSDNAYEDLQCLIVSTIAAAQTPSPGSSNAGNPGQQWHRFHRTKQMKGSSWTCSEIIIIDILDPVHAEGDDLEMPDQHNPLESRLPRIKSSLQAFMNPIFPQDSLIEPYTYFEVLSNVDLSLSLNKVQPFTSTSEHFYRAVSPCLLRKFIGCTVSTDISSVSERQWGWPPRGRHLCFSRSHHLQAKDQGRPHAC